MIFRMLLMYKIRCVGGGGGGGLFKILEKWENIGFGGY